MRHEGWSAVCINMLMSFAEGEGPGGGLNAPVPSHFA
jgi:hypothetical protein